MTWKVARVSGHRPCTGCHVLQCRSGRETTLLFPAPLLSDLEPRSAGSTRRPAGRRDTFSSEALDDERIGMNGRMTGPIFRTIEVGRRAFNEALSRVLDLMREGSVMEWPDEDPPAEPTQILPGIPAPRLRLVRSTSLGDVPAFKRPPHKRRR
jgi:hypothetical protein